MIRNKYILENDCHDKRPHSANYYRQTQHREENFQETVRNCLKLGRSGKNE